MVRYASPRGRWILLATILGSGIAFLDATVVNVALPTIGRQLHAGLASLQWTVNAYTLTLAGLLLLGGSLGDRNGRRRTFVVGVIWFAVASLLCALAPNPGVLVAARALQGVGGALLTPGSLAIIEASFHPEDRSTAIGAWSGLAGVTTAIGPFLGGWLVEAFSWRLIFLINLPLAALVVWITLRHVPESRDPAAAPQLDITGAALAALGLAGVTYALTEGAGRGWTSPLILATGVGGVLALAAFVAVERTSKHPMLPLDIFASRQFTAANLVTFVVYGALGGSFFLLPIQLQRVAGYSPLASGVALVPTTLVMLLLSARAGRLAQRIGPRLPMSLGPLLAAAGLALLIRIDAGGSYLVDVLPGVLVFALGLSLTVAPLTSTVLAAASAEHAGVASAINNDVARVAGLLAVAVLPVAAGISGAGALTPAVFGAGFRMAMLITASLCAAGGLLAFATIRRPGEVPAEQRSDHEPCTSCPISAPPPRRVTVKVGAEG
ncbi:MAG TPA: DHA2 family efflux MFS transporter permease subunit [Actinomycetes bacterium]